MCGSATPMRVDFAYDAAGRFASIDCFANLSGTLLVAGTSDAFDAAGWLTAPALAKGGDDSGRRRGSVRHREQKSVGGSGEIGSA